MFRAERILVLSMVLLYGSGVFIPSSTFSSEQTTPESCAKYSDNFDSYNLDRWQDVLLYSKARGNVSATDGRLKLITPRDEPCEIQVYSLFSLEGDFDIQVAYDFTGPEDLPFCRFNAGMVLQTLGDEMSYKCYVAAAQKGRFFFRARADAFGERNIEKYKGDTAPEAGVLRMVRKDGSLSFMTQDGSSWRTLYTFSEPCRERLRIRFKLQTSAEDEGLEPCPVQISFDNFLINSCQNIVEE